MDRLENIKAMEEAFDSSVAAIERFGEALDAFEAAQDDIEAFADYYGSIQWFEDVDAHAAGELPRDLKCGVLGEDVPFDALEDNHDIAVRMLELAARMLKR